MELAEYSIEWHFYNIASYIYTNCSKQGEKELNRVVNELSTFISDFDKLTPMDVQAIKDKLKSEYIRR